MSAIVFENLQSIKGQPNGLATLGADGKIPVSQLPDTAIRSFIGQFANSAALIAAHPTGRLADYAYVTEGATFWYWNAMLATPAWVNQRILNADYIALSAAAQFAVPYRVITTT